MDVFFRNRKTPGNRAQAMVEFAIVAPILFLMLFGVIEVGRMIFLYAAVTNASREAVRFGSAVGYDDTGVIKYKHCAAIRDVARRASYFTNIPDSNIVIGYTSGTNATPYALCSGSVYAGYVPDGDRVMVQVTGQYTPYIRLVPWGPRAFTAKSYRTILGYVALTSTPNGSGGGGG
ncbi:MAG: TadE/TadG family type IV pilus assembly protein, partial [Syntrophothermus sp.]